MKRQRWRWVLLIGLALVLSACVSTPKLRPTAPTAAPSATMEAIPEITPTPVAEATVTVSAEPLVDPSRRAPTQPLWQYFQQHFGFVDCAQLAAASQRRQIGYQRQSHALLAVLDQSLAEIALVAQKLEAAQLPSEFALLPLVESHYRALASRGNRPAGIWQLMPATARGLGIEVSDDDDGRLDSERASNAAIQLLVHLGQVFNGDWRLVNMAFNAGEYRVRRALRQQRRAGQPRQANTLAVSAITHDHLAKLEALSCWVLAQAADGKLPTLADPQVLVALPLAQPIQLDFLAHLSGLSATRLRQLNPAWRSALSPDIAGLTVLLPTSHAPAARAGLKQLQALPAIPWKNWQAQAGTQNPLDPGLPLDYPISAEQLSAIQQPAGSPLPNTGSLHWLPMRTPASTPIDAVEPAPVADQLQAQRHRVRAGDTLSAIARRYRLKLADLLRWNRLHLGSVIRPGQALMLRGD